MRIAIVNDLGLAVEALRRTVATVPGASVAWIARDGREAVERAAGDPPDLILMDMVMPVMDGVEATRRILAKAPIPILVVTASIKGNRDRVYEALGAGAIDVAATPRLSPTGEVLAAEALLRKILAARTLAMSTAPPAASPPSSFRAPPIATAAPRGGMAGPHAGSPPAAPSVASLVPPLIAVGASTGGPQALVTLLRNLANPLRHAVIIAQHVDPAFAPGLATWLASETGHRVRPIRDGDRPAAGEVLLATSGDHVVLTPEGTLRYEREPRSHPFRPSVDVLFDALARGPVRPGVAVLLTGMGRDGAEGMVALRAAGWTTIAQDRETSAVWGMPGAAVARGAATLVLPIAAIGGAVETSMRAHTVACLSRISTSTAAPSSAARPAGSP